jgi:hypothetical protein
VKFSEVYHFFAISDNLPHLFPPPHAGENEGENFVLLCLKIFAACADFLAGLTKFRSDSSVFPAKAGIQVRWILPKARMDTGVRRYDEKANTQNESLSVRFVLYLVAALPR